LLLAVAAVGSGVLRFVHEQVHAHPHHDDARDERDGVPAQPPASHDESNCLILALLKLPMLGDGVVPVFVLLGLFVAFLTLLPPPPVRSRRPALPLDARGPPVRLPFQPV
jgi:hypothetical protein